LQELESVLNTDIVLELQALRPDTSVVCGDPGR
jgi:hypothetical protein